MSILKSLFTALRGGASEIGEAVVDANAVRILEQEIRDAEEAIAKAKGSLTRMKATEIQLKRDLGTLDIDISDYEAKAIEALESGKEALAEEVAAKIAELEADRNDKFAEQQALDTEIGKINTLIKAREKRIQKNKRELDKVKTVSELQKATASISTNVAATGSSDHRVSKALERVKKKQQNWQDQMEAGEWMESEGSTDSLDAKLAASGIGERPSGASDVLARLKAKKAS